jgi:hypothetical protein
MEAAEGLTTVSDTPFVQEYHCLQQLEGGKLCLILCEMSVFLQVREEIATSHKRQKEMDHAHLLLLEHIVDPADIRMNQIPKDLDFDLDLLVE